MFDLITKSGMPSGAAVAGVIFSFFATILLTKILAPKLPQDQGRAFAVEGTLSKGKVRGVGIVFVPVFIAATLIFGHITLERFIYLIAIAVCMLTGYFDDRSDKPWNEYLKGALDLILAIVVAVTYLYFNGNTFMIAYPFSVSVTIPYVLAGIIIVAVVWTSINVTNCTDGVDGLSATLTIITLGSFWLCMTRLRSLEDTVFIIYFITVLAAYLWFNANPSSMLMGDAGSRAMGMMIAIITFMSGYPLLYIPFAIVMILDGGLGLLKVALLRFLKIKILVNVRCPLHDQARKVKEWSNTQVVFRFAMIQFVVNLPFVLLFMND
ncbi:MAG: phospho-N-acetylmuramoyl-pentapeptide-transferase [Lachnospiraceae bacterium]|nr:phospho-N-acetylmuramoyl-pentapeptide-transferase [Lachnospiraceae bacterium]